MATFGDLLCRPATSVGTAVNNPRKDKLIGQAFGKRIITCSQNIRQAIRKIHKDVRQLHFFDKLLSTVYDTGTPLQSIAV